jgi:hypothetical protein
VISFSVVLKSQSQVISHQNFKIMKQKPLLSFFLFLMAAGGSAQSGEITVTSVQQRSDGSGLVDVCVSQSSQKTSLNKITKTGNQFNFNNHKNKQQ